MEVSSVLQSLTKDSQAAAADKKLGQDFDTFLNLLTTQLQNQDPLDPMKSAEFTNQLVAFSGVEQQIRTNDALGKLLTLKSVDLTSIGIGYIGLDVETSGRSFEFDGATPAALSYTLPEEADATQISIVNENGSTIFTTSGEVEFGKHEFTWDGRDVLGQLVPPGTYTVNVAAGVDDKSLSVPTTVPGHVSGIETTEIGEVLLLIGNKKVPITDVTKATEVGI